MLALVDNGDWMSWGAGLMVGFPIVVIVLSQIAYKLRKSGRTDILTPLDLFRNSTLILIFLTILLGTVVGLPRDHIAVRLVETALWITVINLALAIFNLLFFSGAQGTWRAQVPKLLIDLCRVFIVAICAAFVVSQIWGLDLKAMLAALGVGSLVIGLALQDTLGNLFSGIAVVSGRQIKKGDWIKVGDVEGQVRSINWRTTTVATSTGDLVIIPNGQIARERLRSFGADLSANGILIEFKIPSEQPPQPVLDLILATAGATKGVLEKPQPLARILSFGDGDIAYRAIVYAASYNQVGAVKTEFLANFWYAAHRAGIELPPRPFAEGAKGNSQATAVAAIADKLSALEIFQRFPEQVAGLAGHCRAELYRAGQTLFRTGEKSQRLYIGVAGRTGAYFVDGTERLLVEEFNPGDLVLYKSFLRNGPCPFEVVAITDIEAISVPVAQMQSLLAADRKLALEIERLLSLREEAAERATAHTLAEAQIGHGDTTRVDILKAMFRV